MAGTLTVQNLQGPSSGANANKIIVPSGQTLDASGGTLVPSSDQVVQTQVGKTTSVTSVTTSTYTATALQVTITPKFSNSLIRIEVFSSSYWSSGSASAEYILSTVYRDSTNIGVSSDDSLCLVGAYGSNQNYVKPISFATTDSPSTTSAVVYKMYAKTSAGGNAGVNEQRMTNMIIATEIAQ